MITEQAQLSYPCDQAVPLEATSEDDCLHTDIGRDNNVRLLNDVTDLRHNTFAMPAIRIKLHLFSICLSFGRTHGAPYRGYGYVPLRFGGTSLGEWEHNNKFV